MLPEKSALAVVSLGPRRQHLGMSPVPAVPILVFSDLDGTLIDHATYSWDAAKPALEALRACGGGLILASSKTGPEIANIRAALGWSHWPAIVENGAGLLLANGSGMADSTQYSKLRAILDDTPPALRQHFRGFGDMTAAQVSAVTGLDAAHASLAKTRAFSEPGLWGGTAEQLDLLLNHLSQHGISAREGGRFLTLSFGQTKADRMAELIAEYQPAHTVALGDAPNDVEMLQTADTGVIVANPHRKALPALKGEETGAIIRTALPGPQGWNAAILGLLIDLNLR